MPFSTLSDIRLKLLLFITIIVVCFPHVSSQVIINEKVDYQEVRCLVCHQIIQEIQTNISRINPNIKLDVGGNRLDDSKKRTVEYRLSESYLTELMEQICEVMKDYVKVKHRTTGELMVMPIVKDGQMNLLMSEVDVVQDENLNKSLQLYCEEILENHDEHIIRNLQKDFQTPWKEICSSICLQGQTSTERDEL